MESVRSNNNTDDVEKQAIFAENPVVEPFIISWDSPNDPAQPTNWPSLLRWTLITLVTCVVFDAGMSSSVFAPGVPELMREFNSTSEVLGSLVITIYVLGLATGPMFFGPLSELYGRTIVQHVGNIGFIIWTVACALATNLNMLIGFRLAQGIFAAVPLTNGGGVIADTVRQEERGFALAMLTTGLLAGPVVGPVVGGFLTEAAGWRWSFWLTAIAIAVPSAICLVVWKESYPPVLLERKAKRLREETGNRALRSPYDTGLRASAHFKRGIFRAGKMLVFSPIVTSSSLYFGLCYSYFYLLLTNITSTFENIYHFSTGLVGLAFLGLGVGFLIGQVIFAQLSDRILKHKAKDGEMKPEYRLPLAIAGGFSVPIAFFWYGWSAEAHAHWILPIIGPAFLGLGISLIFVSIQAYLIDAYTVYAASALAATTVVRSLMAALLPLAAPKMYETLGIGWGNSLLAFLALLAIPIPWVLMRYGEQMRAWNEERLRTL